MVKVSIIMPTCDRPQLVGKAIQSVIGQTYQDFELIVVDDYPEKSAENIVKSFKNPRIRYIKHDKNRGGAAARNTGIRASKGEFIAFIDDDDEWLPAKLEIQMARFINTPPEVGFCFSAVTNIYDDKEQKSQVPQGIDNYFELALQRPKGFLTVTLVVKKFVFDKIGPFDKNLPSHQEAELAIRMSQQFKGLGINQPLVKVNMRQHHERVGTDLKKKIAGRSMMLQKHFREFRKRPKILAKYYFQLGLWYRDDGQYQLAKKAFKQAWQTNFKFLYFIHGLSMLLNGRLYKIFKKVL